VRVKRSNGQYHEPRETIMDAFELSEVAEER
jgi:hypothetical protein